MDKQNKEIEISEPRMVKSHDVITTCLTPCEHDRLHMNIETSDLELQREVTGLFGSRYPDMSLNDWRHIIEAYTPMVREAAQPKTKEASMRQYGMAAEHSIKDEK